MSGYWNGYEVNGKPLSGVGYATYRLRVRLDPANRNLALRLLEISTAYSLYLDGEKVGTAGVAGNNRQTTIPRYNLQIVDFNVESDPMEIILQVSNFHHRRGGIWEVIQMGRQQDIRSLQEGMLGLDLFLFGSILIMGIYHLALFWFRKKERSALYFGIFCFLVLVRLLTTGERYLLHLFPAISWALMVRREYLSFYLAVPGFFIFILSQASLLSFRFSNAMTIVEQQSQAPKQTFESYRSEIVERKKTESALQMSEEKYRTILQSIEDGYYEVDLAGNMTFFNEFLCRILGYTRDELLGMNNRRFTTSHRPSTS